MPKRYTKITAAMFFSPIVCNTAWAQVTTATLYGNVADANGAAVPNATVTLINDQTAASAQSQTDAAGEFTFSFLPVGEYTLKVVGSGFKTLLKRGVKLESGQRLRLDSTLEAGGVSDTVSTSSAGAGRTTISGATCCAAPAS